MFHAAHSQVTSFARYFVSFLILKVCEGDNLEREFSFYIRGSDGGSGQVRTLELFCETQKEKVRGVVQDDFSNWSSTVINTNFRKTGCRHSARSSTKPRTRCRPLIMYDFLIIFGVKFKFEFQRLSTYSTSGAEKNCAECDEEFGLLSRGYRYAMRIASVFGLSTTNNSHCIPPVRRRMPIRCCSQLTSPTLFPFWCTLECPFTANRNTQTLYSDYRSPRILTDFRCSQCTRKLCKKCFGRYRSESKGSRACENCVKHMVRFTKRRHRYTRFLGIRTRWHEHGGQSTIEEGRASNARIELVERRWEGNSFPTILLSSIATSEY